MRVVKRKLKVGYRVLRERGILSAIIVSLEFIQKHAGKNRVTPSSHSIDTGADYNEVLIADPSKPANKNWKAPSEARPLTINWLMPPPGKGSGGHMTLFRFIKYLEDAGHECRLYFHRPGPKSTVEQVKFAMGDSFPQLRASMDWLWSNEDMEDADALFATSWQTAYSVYASSLKAKKFYFVQDFEPYFYPVGGFYKLAENTYRLGLRGITAGAWLENKLHDDYGMVADHFDFGSDNELYRITNTSKRRKEIVFYARPTTERRAFELGILTLDLFHRKHPDYIINLIGWDVSQYKIPFPYKNLGILSPVELNKLYNNCSAGLVMSLTNMSLLPLELLASGCTPVVTAGENNTMVSDNKYIRYSDSVPVSLASALSDAATNHDPAYRKRAAKSTEAANWDTAGERFISIVERSVRTNGSK